MKHRVVSLACQKLLESLFLTPTPPVNLRRLWCSNLSKVVSQDSPNFGEGPTEKNMLVASPRSAVPGVKTEDLKEAERRSGSRDTRLR